MKAGFHDKPPMSHFSLSEELSRGICSPSFCRKFLLAEGYEGCPALPCSSTRPSFDLGFGEGSLQGGSH